LKSWQIRVAPHDFAINDLNRHLCARLTDSDRVALLTGVHLRQ
jgi:hypothetical protein